MGPEIRAMIIDDEPLARDLIRRHVYSRTDIHIVGESGTGTEAIRSIKRLHPDLIFLDINLPDINGFQLLEEIKAFGMPAVIFVTAYDEYALRAFEVHAVDYLLKPVGKERFSAAVDRVLHEIRSNKKMEIIDRISLAVAQYRAGSSDTTPKVV